MLSPRKPSPLKVTQPVEVALILAHMSGSLGQEKAKAVVAAALLKLSLPGEGVLAAEQAELLLNAIAEEAGLVGLAAKVTKQMVRNQVAPLKATF
ncbi:MAG: hypothetical protein Q8N23_05945 [Archangium sp.]|nr:hypothetical protein [Archangium sp.]MDP3152192.1 hypothetical protein [Archangium sp.]MDP3574927.1 hypothetical protein [Archangium sp.]